MLAEGLNVFRLKTPPSLIGKTLNQSRIRELTNCSVLAIKKDGVLDSKKGKGGGYFLKLPPSKIPLARIIRKIDGPIAMLPCVSLYFYERCKDCDEQNCGLHDVMILVRDANLKILEKKTVADLTKKE
ncbi:MAG: Rrf2 family transcriptional regulator [Chitinophagaceae bacterium]|nr:Rrf2 family transcriptional regulator [Chitinophagaceae bacterium]